MMTDDESEGDTPNVDPENLPDDGSTVGMKGNAADNDNNEQNQSDKD